MTKNRKRNIADLPEIITNQTPTIQNGEINVVYFSTTCNLKISTAVVLTLALSGGAYLMHRKIYSEYHFVPVIFLFFQMLLAKRVFKYDFALHKHA